MSERTDDMRDELLGLCGRMLALAVELGDDAAAERAVALALDWDDDERDQL